MDEAQREKIALAKKKLRKFQQKGAKVEKNGQDTDSASQVSIHSELQQQAIDILVEEKAELLKTKDKQNAAISQLQDEVTVLKSTVHTTRSELNSSEKKRKSLQTSLEESNSKGVIIERDSERLKREVENLVGQVELLQTENKAMTAHNGELTDKLANNSNNNQVQVSNSMSDVPNPFKKNGDQVTKLEAQIRELESQCELLRGCLSSREQQCDTLAGQISHQQTVHVQELGGLHTRIKELEGDLEEMEQECDGLNEKLQQNNAATAVVSSEAQSSDDVAPPAPIPDDRDTRIGELVTALEEQIVSTITLQKELDNLREGCVDQTTLLTQINNDKATIARAMSQNKQLKETTLDLQDKLLNASEINANMANEVQKLSERLADMTHTSRSEDSILDDVSSRDRVIQLTAELKEVKASLSSVQQERAILGLSAAQVDSVKAMNIALQEKVAELSRQKTSSVIGGGSDAEERVQKVKMEEREEREKQRMFLDKYYEEQLRDNTARLETRIEEQTRQFKQYVTALQTNHEDEVGGLRSQLSELQKNFRSSLDSQYSSLVTYFTSKGSADLRTREEELHQHYMEELNRIYTELTRQKESEELRTRKRTQSDEISVYTTGGEERDDIKEESRDWEMEKALLQSTLDLLEDEIVRVENWEEEEEEENTTPTELVETTASERKILTRVRVLEMQLARAQKQSDRNTSQYKQEIQRQNVVIQKLHMYLATTGSEEEMITEGGEIVTDGREIVAEGGEIMDMEGEGTMENGSETGGSSVSGADLEDKPASVIDTSDYHNHMQKLQVKFARVMKDNANLIERMKDIEHQNTLLEGETDTIGEYIALYQSQRQALRTQFRQKDDFISQLLTERSDMQGRISNLQQLVQDLPLDSTLKDDIMNQRDELLELVSKLDTRKVVVDGPKYPGHRGKVRDM